ncbi:hypothetical protein OBBRIDRAFT_721011 [Obba rivulosa]|uniref:Zn(2)-C6 fungal-type domain-containing protein n=1 Tax=Obba rivulosa TaxID=1052685 RepID=A0A8E2J5U2_9APHY|nr:hypothetical protein OBBRIDRAFT_721011 [Obba rivulosa]
MVHRLSAKTPVVRGARACTVCRQAKMKCVGAEDGNGPCQRCKRAGSDCIFEKHRRGRKPGSRLSEASKMLRRLEKGLSSAKAKSQTTDTPLPPPPSEASTSGQYRSEEGYSPGNSRFPNNELPPISSPYQEGFPRPSARSDVDMDEDDDEADRPEGSMFPVKMIRKERNSFFKTILNPEMPEPPPPRTSVSERSTSHTSSSPLTPSAPQPYPGLGSLSALKDPVELGWLDEEEVKNLFDMFYLRLNPFINLFDPALHSAAYVRARCPLLFTTMLMASCKFFKPELYAQLTRLANDFATRAFMEGWRRVEVVQAFACLTYWKEPTDTRVWMYIGYACRMAVDLRLNRYVGHRTQQESEFELRERRNRERTYLVLFVHDRSLSMQTGKLWMLPECELVRSAETWHEDGGMPMRQEDVIVAAFTHLRRFAADIAERLRNTVGCHGRPEHSQERLIQEVNARLNMWEKQWKHEMDRAGGDEFRYSFLRLFQLHARVFLNSFGVHAAMSQISHPNTQALHVCYNSALDELRIVAKDFATVSMLRYGQDSITVMTAYAAVFLLHMVRGLSAQLPEGARNEVYTVINKAADAYQDAASLIQAHSRSAVFHANFLRSLVVNDKHLHQQQQVQVGHDWSKPVLPPLNLRPSGTSYHTLSALRWLLMDDRFIFGRAPPFKWEFAVIRVLSVGQLPVLPIFHAKRPNTPTS